PRLRTPEPVRAVAVVLRDRPERNGQVDGGATGARRPRRPVRGPRAGRSVAGRVTRRAVGAPDVLRGLAARRVSAADVAPGPPPPGRPRTAANRPRRALRARSGCRIPGRR